MITLLWIIFIWIAQLCTSHETVMINTKLGNIIGNVKMINNNTVYEFLGIPYGVAPIGALRFRPCILNESWNNSTYNATTYGPKCIQAGSHNSDISEDCLYLNIWSTNTNKNAKLPVMFWIHGGGFNYGSASDTVYHGANFVGISDNIILVTINYRLSVLGFLASQQLYDEDSNWASTGGMNGVYDQIQALNWVIKYISYFGGNPYDISIFGESAGGIAVSMLTLSKMLPKNVKRAIIESGSSTGAWGPMTITEGLTASNEVLKQNKLPTNISELRQIPAREFKIDVAMLDSIDGLILDKLPRTLYKNLSQQFVINVDQLMIGWNSLDGAVGWPFYYGPYPKNETQYKEYLELYISNETQVELIMNTYYPMSDFPPYNNAENASIAWFSINADCCIACPSFNDMSLITEANNSFLTYMYEFRGSAAPYYAPHASELPFVFDKEREEAQFDVIWNQSLSDSLISGWTNYGKYGVPNITNSIDKVDIEWKSYNYKTQNVIILDDKIRVENEYKTVYRHGACPFWYDQVGQGTVIHICLNTKTP
eukprot:240908_1